MEQTETITRSQTPARTHEQINASAYTHPDTQTLASKPRHWHDTQLRSRLAMHATHSHTREHPSCVPYSRPGAESFLPHECTRAIILTEHPRQRPWAPPAPPTEPGQTRCVAAHVAHRKNAPPTHTARVPFKLQINSTQSSTLIIPRGARSNGRICKPRMGNAPQPGQKHPRRGAHARSRLAARRHPSLQPARTGGVGTNVHAIVRLSAPCANVPLPRIWRARGCATYLASSEPGRAYPRRCMHRHPQPMCTGTRGLYAQTATVGRDEIYALLPLATLPTRHGSDDAVRPFHRAVQARSAFASKRKGMRSRRCTVFDRVLG